MACYLGIDTSNYTTSAALFRSGDGSFRQERLPLPVEAGALGLRQSGAVFAHVKQLGGLLERLFPAPGEPVRAVGASVSPRDEAGSYMPCFLVGELCARSVAGALGVPLFSFSHQAGHIAAALLSAGRPELAERPFLALHLSGGTTECLLVRPDGERVFAIKKLAGTLDLNAGQAVDRVGGMLGLAFPAGPRLEELALSCPEGYSPRPAMKGMDCCLSGLENLCRRMLGDGGSPAQVARFCLDYIAAAALEMAGRAAAEHPGLPLVFAGGVAANSILRAAVLERHEAHFAAPALSADNAVGTAVLCALRTGEGGKAWRSSPSANSTGI